MMRSDKFRWRHTGVELRDRMRSAGMLNGCGPKAGWVGALVPNRILRLDVEKFCDQHDFNYILGGTEADRAKSDWQFYEAIRERAKELTESWLWRWARPFYLLTAWAYYKAVRLKGAPHFKYGKVLGERGVMELLEQAEATL